MQCPHGHGMKGDIRANPEVRKSKGEMWAKAFVVASTGKRSKAEQAPCWPV